MIRRIIDILRDRFAIDDGVREVAFFDTLIAVLLSQNTTDRNSHRAYRALRDRWDDWEKLSRARQATIARTIRVAGLADLKSAAIKELLRAIRRRWGSIASADFASLGNAARRPRCFECPLYDLCAWPEKERTAAAGKQRLGPRSVTGAS